MSEIKVGDKVRVVQIVAKEKDTKKHTARRMKYLGGTGEVTCISPRLPSAIHVQLTRCLVTHVFHPRELVVLSAPCEQQEREVFVTSGRYESHHEVMYLHEENTRLVKELKQLRRENAGLLADNERWLKRNAEVTGENVRLDAEKESLRKENTELVDGHNRLVTMITELREKYNEALRANDSVRQRLIIIAQEELHVTQE